MREALQGVRVVDLSHVIAGPLASFFLAQFGAEVVKVEQPHGGDVMRSAGGGDGTPDGFVALNAGKRSAALDIRTPQGAEAVRALAAGADVFIENFRPGVVARHGLDYAAIRAVRPDIVYCSISGYGQQGEWARRGAYDHVVQALTGMMMMSGAAADEAPIKVGFPVVDVATGMLAAMAVMAALQQRARTGAGQYIDASMVQASAMLMYPNASAFLSTGAEPQRVGNRGYTGSPTADTYRCRDGWLATAANTPAQFRKLTAVLGLEHLCRDARALDLQAFEADGGFVVARDLDYLRAQFREAFASRAAQEMEDRLNAAGVPAARVRRLGEFLREAEGSGKVDLHGLQFRQGERTVRTPGLGFGFGGEAGLRPGAEPLGASTGELLDTLRG
ncbi:MAG TPA: CoA transferase [Ramlibacter sp.]|nr:CoA transferase [Ramlibacter sp.]